MNDNKYLKVSSKLKYIKNWKDYQKFHTNFCKKLSEKSKFLDIRLIVDKKTK